MVLRTRPAVAKSSAGRSPNSRETTSSSAVRILRYRACPVSVSPMRDPSPGRACTSSAEVSSAIAVSTAESSIFLAPVIRVRSWSRSMAAPLAALTVSTSHWLNVVPVRASRGSKIAPRALSAWPMTWGLRDGWVGIACLLGWVLVPDATRSLACPTLALPTLFRWLAQQTGSLAGMTAVDDARPARLMEKPSWLISEVSLLAHRLLTGKLATAGSRGYHYRLLAALQEFGPASQAMLGRRTAMDRSDVVAAVNELADRGLADRSPDPADRRRNVITITPAGTAHLRRLEKLLAEIQDELLAPLAPADRRQLTRLLTRILEHHA